MSFYSNKMSKFQKQSKTRITSCLYTSYLRLNRNTGVWVGGVFGPQQVTVGVLTLNSHCPRSMWALPTTNTAFGTNSLQPHRLLLLLNCSPPRKLSGLFIQTGGSCGWRHWDQSGVYMNSFWMIGKVPACQWFRGSWPWIKVDPNWAFWKSSGLTVVLKLKRTGWKRAQGDRALQRTRCNQHLQLCRHSLITRFTKMSASSPDRLLFGAVSDTWELNPPWHQFHTCSHMIQR